MLAVVFQMANAKAAIEYRPNAMALLLRALRLVGDAKFWSAAVTASSNCKSEGGDAISEMRVHFVLALQNLSASLAEVEGADKDDNVSAAEARSLFGALLLVTTSDAADTSVNIGIKNGSRRYQ